MISSCAVVHFLFVFFSKEVVPCKFLKDLCLQDNLTMLSQPTLNDDEWRNTSTQTIYLRDTSTQVLPNDYREDHHHPTDEEPLDTRCPKIKTRTYFQTFCKVETSKLIFIVNFQELFKI